MEDEMSALKSLTFTTLPTHGVNPILIDAPRLLLVLRSRN
jgi:hypothetical protein